MARDACRADFMSSEARLMKLFLLAIASRPGGIDVSELAFNAATDGDELIVSDNPATNSLHLEVRRR
jgi:hypothetical protein